MRRRLCSVTAPDRRAPAARLVYVNAGGPGLRPRWAPQRDVREALAASRRGGVGRGGVTRLRRGGPAGTPPGSSSWAVRTSSCV